jgi:hypothetical protein
VKVASKARNPHRARKTSSGEPWRFIGVVASPIFMTGARCSGEASPTPNAGVSMKPCLTTFTLIRRGSTGTELDKALIPLVRWSKQHAGRIESRHVANDGIASRG